MAMPDDAHRYCGGYYDAHTCEEIDSLTERAEKAEAQVQAVRELLPDNPLCDDPDCDFFSCRVRCILGGGDGDE